MHATQSIEVVKPLPLVSGEGWLWKTRYTGIAENSERIFNFSLERTSSKAQTESGIILTAENTLVDPKGVIYAKLYVRLLFSVLYCRIKLTITVIPVIVVQPRGQGHWGEIREVHCWPSPGQTHPQRP